MLGGHSSHSYQNGTNMYFVYDYNVVDCKPEEEIDKYHNPLNKIICEETIRLGGSMVHHHGIGKHRVHWSKLEHGSAWALLEGLKKQFDPNGIMNTGTIYPIEKIMCQAAFRDDGALPFRLLRREAVLITGQ
ncbi:alkyl-dihydroxyacetonephosphate synthase [Escherichia coli]|nr:alkyl-dihydroxyacetonephosphate synthase [Escherichia coli]